MTIIAKTLIVTDQVTNVKIEEIEKEEYLK